MEKAFNKSDLAHIEKNAKYMAEGHYDLCLHKCNEAGAAHPMECKTGCFEDIMVPYHIVKHQAHSGEENLYRKCLSSKLPNIQQSDYISCTKQVYTQRVEMMMSYYASTAEKVLGDIH